MTRDVRVLPGPVFHEPVFSEGAPTHDPTGFLVDHPSDKDTYQAVHDLLSTQVVSFEAARGNPSDLYELETALGPRGNDVVERIRQAGRIVFHSLGDSGSTTDGHQYTKQLSVADQVTVDCNINKDSNCPSFLLHLGDIVYDFGQSEYYYDQFYAPFRDYPAPIFAIPGNHDSFVLPGTAPGQTPLDTFLRNFCSTDFVVTPEAKSLHRTAMTQPGVYFALDAPFVRIICLFSNALEDPGVISNDAGKWPDVPNHQLEFLDAQLRKIRETNYKGAVLIAVHHPPFSYAPESSLHGGAGAHGCSTAMLRQIDALCSKNGVYPHAFLSAHAHLYQRFTRTLNFEGKDIDVPFIVCGDGGHHVNPLVRAKKGEPAEEPHFGTDVSYLDVNPAIKSTGLTLEKYNDREYGYLRISADKDQLAIGFHIVGDTTIAQSRFDKVTVDLSSHELIAN